MGIFCCLMIIDEFCRESCNQRSCKKSIFMTLQIDRKWLKSTEKHIRHRMLGVTPTLLRCTTKSEHIFKNYTPIGKFWHIPWNRPSAPIWHPCTQHANFETTITFDPLGRFWCSLPFFHLKFNFQQLLSKRFSLNWIISKLAFLG